VIWHEDEIVGHIEFFTPVSYWDAFELSYQLYGERHAGHGYTTEAVQLLVDYLTATKKQHRIHRSRERGEPSGRGEVRVRARGHGARRVLQRRRQPRRSPLLLLRTDPRPW
jgi:[ribosomal protein S5]-alanine N-acetyltransferase